MRPFGFQAGRGLRWLPRRVFLAVVFVFFIGGPAARADTSPAAALPADTLPALDVACEPGAWGCFRDPGGQWLREKTAYRLLLEEDSADHVRNLIEMGVFLAAGTTWYWLDDNNAFDFDEGAFKQRFTLEAYTFDNNDFPMNFFFHAWSGTGYYAFSRANRLGLLGSALSAFLTSWTWEFVIEFKERVSINDQIVTPLAGVVWGEFFFKLGRYLNETPRRGLLHDVARWTVGFPQAFHNALDGIAEPPADARTNRRGMHPDIAARFRLAYAPTLARPSEGPDFMLHEVAVDGMVATLPGYLRPGRFQRFFADANISTFRLRLRPGSAGFGTEIYGDTTLLGLHHQNIAPEFGGQWGHAVTLGTGMNYLYRTDSFDNFTDQQAVLGFPGLSFDTHAYLGRLSLHVGVRLNADFAGMQSNAYAAWQEDNPALKAKTVLQRHSYYYGWGGTARVHAEVHAPWLQLGASLRHGRWISQQGLDRSQERVTGDVASRDQALDWEAWLRLLPFDGPWFVEFVHGGQHRRSQMMSFSEFQGVQRYQVSFGKLL